MGRPPKIKDVTDKVKTAAEAGNYRPTAHAFQRMNERDVDATELDYVLRKGSHVGKHDEWKEEFQDWNYGFCGKTVDGKRIRLALAFAAEILIVTVINEDLDDE